eukprot:scaffold3337_cov95-Cylindrotheca_fusiformis.AAC.1
MLLCDPFCEKLRQKSVNFSLGHHIELTILVKWAVSGSDLVLRLMHPAGIIRSTSSILNESDDPCRVSCSIRKYSCDPLLVVCSGKTTHPLGLTSKKGSMSLLTKIWQESIRSRRISVYCSCKDKTAFSDDLLARSSQKDSGLAETLEKVADWKIRPSRFVAGRMPLGIADFDRNVGSSLMQIVATTVRLARSHNNKTSSF